MSMSMSMWASPSGSGNSNNNSTTSFTCSPSNSTNCNSKSRSSSTCSSPTTKSMEQVWKDITLASDLHHHSTTISPTTLQDFLATPFHKHHPPKKDASSSAAADTTFLPSLTPQPAGLLSFNSGSGVVDLGFLESTNASTVQVRAADPQSRTVVNATPSNFVATYNSALLDTLGSSSVFPSRTNNTKKRPKENGDASTDRRHKRLIKNRESAARSRARKQESWLSIYPLAYTNELELEVAHLQEENARLRRQQTKVYLAAAAQLPKQHTLYRTLTAPF
ncbi:hypothetical protein FNV43_RR10493 [Rhamnella rubrinervis]|uniref:BZIP domain-containing protein n=1 Tax=Rhamnella rubrinervis TaxID=2594499 RepID=A0A8K0H4F9_9ROSA|nr:hypothetical protein FNV43_RR10493 [Rhamnella rubrinervis]